MPALFVLEVETDAGARAARLRLNGPEGEPIAEHRVELGAHPLGRWEGLFNTRQYVRRTARDPRQVEVLLDTIGGFMGRAVLGPDITRALVAGEQRRGLLVQLPGQAGDPLAAALTRAPWEIARVEGDLRTLQQRNVLVRVSTAEAMPPEGAGVAPRLVPQGDEPVRVLLVFAEAPGARPAGARQEREELLETFFQDILPHRDVEVDVLCHGVSRARLWDQVRRRGGYHIVHWSGRARGDALEIALEEGDEEEPLVSGAELADLFSGAGAGEALPRLFFLSACRAGPIGSATDWASLRAALRPVPPPPSEGAAGAQDEIAPILAGPEGATTGVALALIGAGVPEVVAFRHEVGPAYARALARRFYLSLLAGELADSALASARRELAEEPAIGAPLSAGPGSVQSLSSGAVSGTFPAVSWSTTSPSSGAGDRASPVAGVAAIAPEDHVAPVLLGVTPVRFVPAARASAQAGRRAPRARPLLTSGSKDLDPAPGFLGRGAELTQLARRWLPEDGAPVALLEGAPGVGKTALAGEVIHLWHGAFEHVLAVQAYGWPVPPAVLLQHAARRLAAARAERWASSGAAQGEPHGAARLDGDGEGDLAEAMRSERVLLVLDGIGAAAHAAAWAELLGALRDRLRGSASRVLATACRIEIDALPDRILRVPLGPLPLNEAALLADRCAPLRALLRGDADAEALGRRVLEVGRGHPLVLLRLGDLATPRMAPSEPRSALAQDAVPGASSRTGAYRHPTGRAALERALERLEKRFDSVDRGSLRHESADSVLLEELTEEVVDLLLEVLGPGARRLLWGVTLAGEPVKAWMVEELGSVLLTPDERLRPALDELLATGLISRQAEEARGTAYGFHEIVAARAAAWMDRFPEERGGATTEDLWRSYGERYSAAFRNAVPMLQQGLASAAGSAEPSSLPSSSTPSLDLRSRPLSSPTPDTRARPLASPPPGSRARPPATLSLDPRSWPSSTTQLTDPRLRPPSVTSSVDARGGAPAISIVDPRASAPLRRPHELAAELGRRAIRYLIRGRGFKALSAFAAAAVNMVADGALLAEVIADLEVAADHASGEARWRTRIALADALRNARRVGEALPLYAHAAEEAEAAAHWGDVGVIRNKWADALAMVERYEEARTMYERSADAKRRAGRPRISALAAELDALRMDVACGAAAEALPKIEQRLERLRSFWERRQRGEEVREAPDDTLLAETLAAALDVARRANAKEGRWLACLHLLDELELVERAIGAGDHERTRVRFYRVTPLIRLGRLEEAFVLLEACLDSFRRARDFRGEARTLSALANVRIEQGDGLGAIAFERDALAVRERSAGATERAHSHHRLAALLHRAGRASEAAEHGLAAAAYQLAAGHDPYPELRDLAARGGPSPRLLRLHVLLERPSFLPLRRSLAERAVAVDALQSRLDELFLHAIHGGEGERRPPAEVDEDRDPSAPDPAA